MSEIGFAASLDPNRTNGIFINISAMRARPPRGMGQSLDEAIAVKTTVSHRRHYCGERFRSDAVVFVATCGSGDCGKFNSSDAVHPPVRRMRRLCRTR